jgi:hypothetical protein
MTEPVRPSSLERRSFLSRLAAGAAMLGLGSSAVRAQAAPGADWTPTVHAEDEWLSQMPGQHRFFFDTTTVAGAGEGLLYANNYFVANKNGYDLDDDDLAVVICLRHFSTPLAFNDAMWAKYGAAMAGPIQAIDPQTRQAPTKNLYLDSSYGMTLPNGGVTLDALIGRGVHFAVCDMATTFFSGMLAQGTGGSAETVYKELVSNRIANSHMVTAGIVAVNRAQERGYSISHVG